jgi:hypothetical protein
MLKVNFYDCPVKTILMSYLCQLNTTVGAVVETTTTRTMAKAATTTT